MAVRLDHFLCLALVISNVREISGHTHICATSPELTMLSADTLDEFNCQMNKTSRVLNCTDRGVPSLPRSGDKSVAVDTEIFDFSYNSIRCLPKINNTRNTCSVKDCHAGCLLELHLQHNEIDFLHDEVFLDLVCLHTLDLSFNQITNQTLGRQHFFRLNNLQHLDLHGNPLSTLPDNVLISTFMSHLRTINLSSCQLQSIGELAIDDFNSLEVLDLSNNELSVLANITFQGLVSLTTLDLRWNRLRVIEQNTFASMRKLQVLLLDHNILESVSELAFSPWVELEYLSLLSNSFRAIPVDALSKVKKLRRLDVSHNPIEKLDAAHDNTTVEELKLDSLVSLTRVGAGAFSAFPLLTSLSLRYCSHWSSISNEAFRGSSSSLKEVLLDNNGLTTVPQDLLPWKQLRLLTLHGNPWVCECNLAWIAGRPLGNTSLICQGPPKLRGQAVESLTESEMSCPVSILGVQVVTAVSVAMLILTTVALVLWRRQRRMFCWCLRGDNGRYVTIFTKENVGQEGDPTTSDTCTDGEVDDLDLDLGTGEDGEEGSGRGKVRFMMKTLNNGYRLLKGRCDGESSQDLTSACDF